MSAELRKTHHCQWPECAYVASRQVRPRTSEGWLYLCHKHLEQYRFLDWGDVERLDWRGWPKRKVAA